MSWEIVIAALVGAAVAGVVAAVGVVLWLNLTQPEQHIDFSIKPAYHPGDEQFRRSMAGLLPPGFVEGNRIRTLVDGEEIFPAMLDAIRDAERSITFESYVWWAGEVGHRFADTLVEKAGQGVEVRVLLDWAGSKAIGRDSLKKLRESRVKICPYHPPSIWNLSTLNHRTHRKLLVIDGRLGFTGGVGIADQWTSKIQNNEDYRDNHYRVEGPVVAQIQGAFIDNWQKASGEVLHSEVFFPKLEPAGSAVAQMFRSSPAAGATSARLMFLLSITAARERIRLGNPYLVPDDQATDALVAARERGVEVDIILPSGDNMDYPLVRCASRWRWGELLEAGVRLHEYRPAMYHCKVLIVDDVWVSVGSANFDYRSFGLNDEANLNVLDGEFTREQVALFERDLERCTPVTLEQWRRRTWGQRLADRAASLLRSQL